MHVDLGLQASGSQVLWHKHYKQCHFSYAPSGNSWFRGVVTCQTSSPIALNSHPHKIPCKYICRDASQVQPEGKNMDKQEKYNLQLTL